ncbi:carboxypeptidase-like regulatory domain-containing protein [Flavobacterium sp. PS2]|uniref:carboxypeptidase-like regulatory domain-containing protein n=1 Tax=Flavobacterium sp. PS2 TaxID=3384157 RepID=UPI00390C4376
MKNNIQITIPEPCHENWLEMTPTEKGRFCNNCQKNVIDFTKASDREILMAYTKNNILCGRFNSTQLNRKITTQKEKNSYWTIAAASVITFLGLGEQSVKAQEATKTEQTDTKQLNDTISEEITYTGTIYDEEKLPLSGANITINKIQISSDFDGKFSVKAKKGDILQVAYITFEKKELKLSNNPNIEVNLKRTTASKDETLIMTGVIVIRKPEDEYIEF